MRPVIIVESPAKCKKIESFLNNEYECIATCGHIRELKKGVNSIDISNKSIKNLIRIIALFARILSVRDRVCGPINSYVIF